MSAHRNWIKILKIAIGSSIAFTAAEALKLQYATSAAVIVLLSIQNTKKDTWILAWRRMSSFGITLFVAFIIYHFIGFQILAFTMFIFCMLVITYILDWSETLSVNALIGMHFLVEKNFSFSFIRNEVTIVFLGMAIALVLNLYIPDIEKDIKKDIHLLEQELQVILKNMADCLKNRQPITQIDKSLPILENHIETGLKKAFDNMKNSFNYHAQYYIMYMEMRKGQSGLLENMRNSICQITICRPEALEIAEFLEHIAISLQEKNNVETLMHDFGNIKLQMSKKALPETREEFEDRAILYYLLLDTERFLLMKQEFVSSLTKEQIDIYWQEER